MTPLDSSSFGTLLVPPQLGMAANPTSVLNGNDVLMGRGGATNAHVGNRRFRAIVARYQDEYLSAKKKQKAVIARKIVAEIQQAGGRFLKRDDRGTAWVTVPDKKATEKTSQALREGLDVRHKRFRTERMPKTSDETTAEAHVSQDSDGRPLKRSRTSETAVMISPELSSMPHPSSQAPGGEAIMPDLHQEMNALPSSSYGGVAGDESLFLYLPAPVLAHQDDVVQTTASSSVNI